MKQKRLRSDIPLVKEEDLIGEGDIIYHNKTQDPVRSCNLYKEDGCAHVDGMLCDFETCSMRIGYDNKYTALVRLVEEHNKCCDSDCSANAKYCVDYLAVGRRCSDCPKYYKVDI